MTSAGYAPLDFPTIPANTNDTKDTDTKNEKPKQQISNRPNILMIAIDDLNNWVGYIANHTAKGHPQSLTPNMDRLSAMGLSFTNAHASSTICNPSRAAVFSGVRSSTSGCYDNEDVPWQSYIKEGMSINAHFKQNGYYVAAMGKTTHSSHGGMESNPEKIYADEWDDYPKRVKPAKLWDKIPKDVGYTLPIEFEIGDEEEPDWHTTDYCIDRLGENATSRDGKPLFLVCGYVKPHLPWLVPKRYYDLYPRSSVKLPPYPSTNDVKEWESFVIDDLKDIPEYALKHFAKPEKFFSEVIESGRWEAAIQAYLATIQYLDMNLGRLLDAFEASPESDNTIISLWSDHGYHHGEKGHWKKSTLWEEASDVPFIWVVPGLTTPGSISNAPVDLQSIYPTLCDLANISRPAHVDGDNIRPLLKDPDKNWNGVAKINFRYRNHAVVDRRFRYIQYSDGSEELYDHDADPHEFTNLANVSEYAETKKRLSLHLPKVDMKRWHNGKLAKKVDISCNKYDLTIMRCPDGETFVGRNTTKKCKFSPCPAATANDTNSTLN